MAEGYGFALAVTSRLECCAGAEEGVERLLDPAYVSKYRSEGCEYSACWCAHLLEAVEGAGAGVDGLIEPACLRKRRTEVLQCHALTAPVPKLSGSGPALPAGFDGLFESSGSAERVGQVAEQHCPVELHN